MIPSHAKFVTSPDIPEQDLQVPDDSWFIDRHGKKWLTLSINKLDDQDTPSLFETEEDVVRIAKRG